MILCPALLKKLSKFKRVMTKVDNEKETVAEVDANLRILEEEEQSLKGEFDGFVQLRNSGGEKLAKY